MLKNWNTPAVNILQGFCVLVNFTAGVFGLMHHHIGGGIVNIAVSFFILGANIYTGITHNRLRVVREELRRELEMTLEDISAADEKAEKNLARVIKAVGGDVNVAISGTYVVDLKENDVTFRVTSSHIWLLVRDEAGNFCESASTCIQVSRRVPKAEIISTALLLLHHDPYIFKKWWRQDGFHV